MDSTISQEKEDLIGVGHLGLLLSVLHELLQEWGEDSWTSKLDLWQSLLVRGHDVLNSHNLWVHWVSIDWEAVGDLHGSSIQVSWDTTKAEGGEGPISIVRLNDLANHTKSLDILIAMAQGMERWATLLSGVRGRVVDGGDHGDAPS